MTVNYAVIFSDARTCTGQCDTFAQAAAQVQRAAQDHIIAQGKAVVYARVSNSQGAEVGVELTDGKFPAAWQRIHDLDRQVEAVRAALKAQFGEGK